MFPKIGPIETYTIVYALSMILHLVLVLIACRRQRLSKRAGFLLSLTFTLGMTVGAKILYDVQHDGFAGWKYFDWRYIVLGGLWGGPLAYLAIVTPAVFLLARNRAIWLDLIAVTLVPPMIVAKIACFFNGCCFGLPTSMPWAVTFPEGAEAPAGIARHPTQFYEILVFIFIWLVFRWAKSQQSSGSLLLWFVFLYGLGRPLTEVFRQPEEARTVFIGPFTSSQLVCITAAIAAALGLISRRRRSGRRNQAVTTPPESGTPTDSHDHGA